MSFKIESKVTKSSCIDEDLFDFLSDFTRFTKMLPPQHQQSISATPTQCTINAGIMGAVVLTYAELDRPKLLKICPAMDTERLKIWVQLKRMDAYDTRIKITISVDAGFMAKMAMKSQLQQFADGLADGIAQIQPYMLKQI